MKVISLKSTKRESVGKGQAGALRRKGMIPAVLYGRNLKSVKLSVESSELHRVLRIGKAGQILLDLDLNGVAKKVTIKELQKHPVSSEIMNVDFYEVSMTRKMKIGVPVVMVGTCKGVELGGMLQIIRREVEVLCLPNNIPDSVVVDVTDLDIGDSFHLADLHLPDGVEVPGETNFTVLTVLSQKTIDEDDVETIEEDNIDLEEGDSI